MVYTGSFHYHKRTAAPAKAYAQHYDGYFDESADYYDDDYASTIAPDSDDELMTTRLRALVLRGVAVPTCRLAL